MTDEMGTRLDEVFTLLSDGDRRRLLYYLREHGSATRTELADVLAGWLATDRPDGVVGDGQHQRIESTLYHQHLPRLREKGIVDVRADGTVTAMDWPPWFDQFLDIAFEVEVVRSETLREVTGRLTDDREQD